MSAKLKLVPLQSLPWPIDYEDGVLPIAAEEGCLLKAYLCPAGVWTCGWGETDSVGPNTKWSQEFADQRFCDSLSERTAAVLAACTIEPTKYQLAALVGFSYNYGKWKTSQVLKAHNRGDFLSASRAFGLVNQYTDKKTGKLVVSAGLTARRAREAALYLRPSETTVPMPQAVANENAVATGPIASSGAIAAGTGVMSLVSATGEHVGVLNSTLKTVKMAVVDTLGVSADMFLPMVLVTAGVVVVWFRYKQRILGWV